MRLQKRNRCLSSLCVLLVAAASGVYAEKPVKVVDDPYEPNNSLADAYQGLPADMWLSEHNTRGIHNDDDWYRIDITDPDFMRVRVECLHTVAEGDIDLALYNASGVDLKMVWTTTDNEYLDFTVGQTGAYYIRVFAADSEPDGNSYDLRWKALVSDDLYEPNNTLAQAYTGLAEGVWLSTLEGPGLQKDDDWYRVHVSDPNRLRLIVDCTFIHAEGDIDIVLYDAAGVELDYPWTTTDNEQIDFVVSATGYYFVKVCFDNAGNAYDLHWITVAHVPLSLTYITISGPDSVNENSSAQYTCTAHYSNGSSADVSASATWSENSAYAAISSGGVLTTASVSSDQTVTVTAVYADQSADKSVVIKNVAPVVSSLSISGPDEVTENSTAQYYCTAHYSDGSSADVSTSATWSENSAYAAISSGGVLSVSDVPADEAAIVQALYGGFSATREVMLRSSVQLVSYESWLFQQEVPENMMAYEDDPAGDGVPNLLKYACGLPALEFCDTSDLMTLSRDPHSGNFAIIYKVSKSAVDAGVEALWAASPAGPWYPVAIVESIGEEGSIEYWRAPCPAGERGFMRLRALPFAGGLL